MKQRKSQENNFPIPFMSLLPFLIVTFCLAWGILALYIFFSDQMIAIFGQLTGNHPLFFLAVYSPAIAAIMIILYYTGFTGLEKFLKRMFLWRCSLLWYIFLLVGIPLIFYCGAAFKGSLFNQPFPFDSFRSLILALSLAMIKGPAEEFGWRGFVQPLLQQKFAPIWAGLIIGFVWGLWHLPAFLLSGTQQSSWSFLPFFIGTIAISLIMTQLYNSSKGSILLAALMHFQLMNPIWPDVQPYDTYILTVIAAFVVYFKRKEMFDIRTAFKHII